MPTTPQILPVTATPYSSTPKDTNKGAAIHDLDTRVAVLEAGGNVGTADIAPAAVTPAKLSPTGVKSGSFTGRNGAGAITLTGAAVGDRVWAVSEIDTSSGTVNDRALFEATITVINQIQQASASDLSTKKYAIVLIPAAS
jgi:hypothetical protein